MSQQHGSVSQGWICSDNFTCCHSVVEAADQTFCLTQSQFNLFLDFKKPVSVKQVVMILFVEFCSDHKGMGTPTFVTCILQAYEQIRVNVGVVPVIVSLMNSMILLVFF